MMRKNARIPKKKPKNPNPPPPQWPQPYPYGAYGGTTTAGLSPAACAAIAAWVTPSLTPALYTPMPMPASTATSASTATTRRNGPNMCLNLLSSRPGRPHGRPHRSGSKVTADCAQIVKARWTTGGQPSGAVGAGAGRRRQICCTDPRMFTSPMPAMTSAVPASSRASIGSLRTRPPSTMPQIGSR